MCLDVINNAEIKTAKEDIVCWKFGKKEWGFFRNFFVSPYYRFKYRVGKVYKMEGKLEARETVISGDYIVNEGFHSFLGRKTASAFSFIWDRYVAKCVIPKGTRYIEGKFLDTPAYASEQIKVIKIYKI